MPDAVSGPIIKSVVTVRKTAVNPTGSLLSTAEVADDAANPQELLYAPDIARTPLPVSASSNHEQRRAVLGPGVHRLLPPPGRLQLKATDSPQDLNPGLEYYSAAWSGHVDALLQDDGTNLAALRAYLFEGEGATAEASLRATLQDAKIRAYFPTIGGESFASLIVFENGLKAVFRPSADCERTGFALSRLLNKSWVPPSTLVELPEGLGSLGGQQGVLQLMVPGKEGTEFLTEHLSPEIRNHMECTGGCSHPWAVQEVPAAERADAKVFYFLVHGFDVNAGCWRLVDGKEPSDKRLVLYDLEGAFDLHDWHPWGGGEMSVEDLDQISAALLHNLRSLTETDIDASGIPATGWFKKARRQVLSHFDGLLAQATGQVLLAPDSQFKLPSVLGVTDHGDSVTLTLREQPEPDLDEIAAAAIDFAKTRELKVMAFTQHCGLTIEPGKDPREAIANFKSKVLEKRALLGDESAFRAKYLKRVDAS